MMESREPRSIRERLLYEMKHGLYSKADKLPPEEALSEILGISRTQLRDSLSSLEREGFIIRRRGIGTLINKEVLSVMTRMDLEQEFSDMISETGAEPGIALVEIENIPATAQMANKLRVSENTPVIRVTRLLTADGRPAIFCYDHISFRTVKDYSYQQADLEKPIFYFLNKYCGIDVSMDLTVVRPMVADEKLATVFDTEVGQPILHMDEVGYDINCQPVLWSDEYYMDGIIEHTVLRKKI